MNKDDIVKLAKILDNASVPQYNRVAAITDKNGTVIVSGSKYSSECWTVIKHKD